MRVEADDQGRITLPAEIRDKHGRRFHLIDLPHRVVLIPISENPLEAVREAMGHMFSDQSIEEIKTETIRAAKDEITQERNDIDNRTTSSTNE